MAGFSIGGLATGLDTKAIVQQLTLLEARSLQRYEQRRTQIQAQQRDFGTFKAKLQKLSSLVKELDQDKTLAPFKTTTSNDKVVTLTAGANAVTASHTISVTQLAQARTIATSAFADRNETRFGDGRIDIQVGEDVVSVDILADRDDTLEGIRDAINGSGAEVQASIINDGTGFRLVVASKKTGVENAVSLLSTNFTFLDDNHADGPTELKAAQDAQFTVDGLAVTSASNVVTGVLDGITFTLKDVGANVTVSVDKDAEAITKKLQSFVDAYNDVVTYIDSQSGTNDTALRSIKSQLRGALQTTLTAGLGFTAASNVGIRTDAAGKLTLDKVALDKAIDENYEGFLGIVRGSKDGTTAMGLADVFDRVLNGSIGDPSNPDDDVAGILTTGNGLLAARNDSLGRRLKSIDAQIASENRRLDRFETNLTRRFAAYESLTSRYQAQGAFVQQILFGGR